MNLHEEPEMKHLRSAAKKRLFLKGVGLHGTVTKAAEHAGISRMNYYYWIDKPNTYKLGYYDPEFCMSMVAAEEEYKDRIRAEINRRAVEGIDKNIYGSLGHNAGSGVVGTETQYSDQLLIHLSKIALPEARTKNMSEDESEKSSDSPGVGTIDVSKLNKQERADLRRLLNLAQGGEKPIEGELIENKSQDK